MPILYSILLFVIVDDVIDSTVGIKELQIFSSNYCYLGEFNIINGR